MDTTEIVFICGGAFCGLDSIVRRRIGKRAVGFTTSTDPELALDEASLLQQVKPQDLIQFGLLPELIGRLPVLTTTNPLDEDDLCAILVEPRNALVKQYQRLFEMEDTQLTFTDDALSAIAQRAIERKTGARGLRSILEGILLDTMFELPGMDEVTEVVVNEEAVTSDAKPLLIYADQKKEGASAG